MGEGVPCEVPPYVYQGRRTDHDQGGREDGHEHVGYESRNKCQHDPDHHIDYAGGGAGRGEGDLPRLVDVEYPHQYAQNSRYDQDDLQGILLQPCDQDPDHEHEDPGDQGPLPWIQFEHSFRH